MSGDDLSDDLREALMKVRSLPPMTPTEQVEQALDFAYGNLAASTRSKPVREAFWVLAHEKGWSGLQFDMWAACRKWWPSPDAEAKRTRPSFESIHMRMAVELAKRSTCTRLHVGCVIASEDFRQVLAVGYNGNATGLPNECDSDVPGACGCLHAEENAVIHCVAPRAQSKIVFSTNLPCKMCAKRFVNLGGVKKIHYLHEYRLREGVDVLTQAGIPILLYTLEDVEGG